MIRHLTKPSVDHQNSPSTINFYQLFADDLAGGMSIGSTGGQAAKGGKIRSSSLEAASEQQGLLRRPGLNRRPVGQL